MPELEIIGAPQSIFVRSARMACEEKGVAYRLTPARPHSPEVDCIHPFGKIPVMRYGDFHLFESKAIATFVDRAFPGPKLIPDDPKLCGKVEQWVSAENTTIFPAILLYFMGYFFPRTPDGQPDRAAIEAALPELRAHLNVLDKAVAEAGHLAGQTSLMRTSICYRRWPISKAFRKAPKCLRAPNSSLTILTGIANARVLWPPFRHPWAK
jgi:glutathione S-transferase